MASIADVDAYVSRAEAWPDLIDALRPILRGCGLTETIKWAKPCYTHDGRNIVIVQEMKAFLALMFFEGAFLHDPDGVLESQGPNSRSARRITFTTVGDVERLRSSIELLVTEAIDLDATARPRMPAPDLVLVDELRHRLDADATLRAAFEALTPGRRREINLYVAGAKRSETRVARVIRCEPKIRAGKGLRDR